MTADSEILDRIRGALESARAVLKGFTPGAIEAEYKSGHDPVTEADRAVDEVLHRELWREGEGWLSEEGTDDLSRLAKRRVWIVDPLDGTREFVAGVPEFCVSVALIEEGQAIAGGICNPVTDEVIVGSLHSGVTYNGKPVGVSAQQVLAGAVVLASRSEIKRGQWREFEKAPFKIQPMGSVAYKLALVAAGKADATFTLSPKHEWDVAGGVALVKAAGGFTSALGNSALRFNQQRPWLSGLIACNGLLGNELLSFVRSHAQAHNTAIAKIMEQQRR